MAPPKKKPSSTPPLPGVALELSKWEAKKSQVAEEMYRAALALGGTITGEHGIGLTRKRFLPLVVDGHQIGLMRKIKEAFDPGYMLNPGKVFPSPV